MGTYILYNIAVSLAIIFYCDERGTACSIIPSCVWLACLLFGFFFSEFLPFFVFLINKKYNTEYVFPRRIRELFSLEGSTPYERLRGHQTKARAGHQKIEANAKQA
jgi:hypothetical protein